MCCRRARAPQAMTKHHPACIDCVENDAVTLCPVAKLWNQSCILCTVIVLLTWLLSVAECGRMYAEMNFFDGVEGFGIQELLERVGSGNEGEFMEVRWSSLHVRPLHSQSCCSCGACTVLCTCPPLWFNS